MTIFFQTIKPLVINSVSVSADEKRIVSEKQPLLLRYLNKTWTEDSVYAFPIPVLFLLNFRLIEVYILSDECFFELFPKQVMDRRLMDLEILLIAYWL